jgi:hypothetical protein
MPLLQADNMPTKAQQVSAKRRVVFPQTDCINAPEKLSQINALMTSMSDSASQMQWPYGVLGISVVG